MAGLNLAAIGAGLGIWAQNMQQQRAQQERQMQLQMQMQRYQQEQKDRQDQEQAAAGRWQLGNVGGVSPAGATAPTGDLSGLGGIPGASAPAVAAQPQPMSGRDFGGGMRAGGALSDPRNLSGYITETAQKYGIDPSVALRVYGAEGLGNPVGDRGTSFGAPQLHIGGGLGDEDIHTQFDPCPPQAGTAPPVERQAGKNSCLGGLQRSGQSNDCAGRVVISAH